ncbi:MAG: hypothetical protein WAT19_07930 [Ferruginibacter sp.]
MTENFEIPDFSGDDFADDKEIQQIRAAEKAYLNMVNEALELIKRNLNVIDSSHINLKGFHMFKSLYPILRQSMKSVNSNKKLRISLASYSSSFPTAKSANSGTDQYLFGHLETKNKYPRAYFHRETIKEKIENIFLRRDVDFKNSRAFSRKFQALTEDKDQLLNLLQFKDLDILTNFPEMEFEFCNNTMLFRTSRKAISVEEASIFCELSKAMEKLFG